MDVGNLDASCKLREHVVVGLFRHRRCPRHEPILVTRRIALGNGLSGTNRSREAEGYITYSTKDYLLGIVLPTARCGA